MAVCIAFRLCSICFWWIAANYSLAAFLRDRRSKVVVMLTGEAGPKISMLGAVHHLSVWLQRQSRWLHLINLEQQRCIICLITSLPLGLSSFLLYANRKSWKNLLWDLLIDFRIFLSVKACAKLHILVLVALCVQHHLKCLSPVVSTQDMSFVSRIN